MKKNEIEEVIISHFKRIDKLFHKIIVDFQTEDIQQFRVEIKKLRSFLHLLDMESNEGIPLRMTKKMKTFYGYAGIIHNLQLQLKRVTIYLENSTNNIHVSYLETLQNGIEDWEKNAKYFMDQENNFYNDEKEILSGLPYKLSKKSIKKFLQFILYELQNLLTRLDDDEALHSIRKFLKDVLYNWTFIQQYITYLPAGLSNEEEARSFIEILGHFRDKCITLVLLQTYYNDSLENEEKKILQQIEHEWKREKQELRQIIFTKIDLIHLVANKVKVVTLIDSGYDQP